MKINKLGIEGVVELLPQVFEDERGYFLEQFRVDWFKENVDNVEFVQINRSKSIYGVLRGMHFQKGEHAQGKLVTCLSGRVLDVALDIREGSKTYGKWIGVELSSKEHNSLYIPRGLAHGFLTLSPTAEIQYMCDNYYCKEAEGHIHYLNKEFNINWGMDPIFIKLSEKDAIRE